MEKVIIMTISPNHQSLIQQVEATSQLESRFENIRCVNINGGRRRGVLSLVFQGYDILEEKDVAIKFMDPDRLGDKYSIDTFEREPDIISKLNNNKRCLSLVSDINLFPWCLNIPGSKTPINISLQYFTVEWLEEDIEDYFLEQHDFNALEKLEIFRLILLAVEAVHSSNISHRDLKPDNMRLTVRDKEEVVVIIDFNRAAQKTDKNIATEYKEPAGANAYSSPESFVGFAGDRDVENLTDIYGLGCLLYELFNKEIFGMARSRNPNFDKALYIMANEMLKHSNNEDKLNAWKKKMPELHHVVIPPIINGPSHSIPPCLVKILDRLYSEMTVFNFMERKITLSKARKSIDSAIKILLNEKKQKKILDEKRNKRKIKLEKIRRRDERLNHYLKKGGVTC